jgi:hypothetical protein
LCIESWIKPIAIGDEIACPQDQEITMSEAQRIDHITVSLDSNILIHFKPLRDIDWLSICQAKQVTLLICFQVIKELDDKKSDPRLSERAKRAIKEIGDLRGTEFRPGVRLEVFNKALRAEEFPADMSFDCYDDRIIRSVELYVANHPEDTAVGILTEDYGMVLRCEAHSVRVYRLPADHRLESPQDEQTRKLRQAQAELAAMKNRLPDISLIVTRKGCAVSEDDCAELLPLPHPELFNVEERLQEEKRIHPKMEVPTQVSSRLGNLGFEPTPEEVRRYNDELDLYFESYEAHLHQYNQWLVKRGVTYEFDLYLSNRGGAEASHIEIELTFPSFVHGLFSDEVDAIIAFDPPAGPELPKKPISRFGGPDLARLGLPHYGLPFRNPLAPVVEIQKPEEHKHAENGPILHCQLLRLMHTKDEKVGTFFVTFFKPADVKPFQASYSVLTAELPAKSTGQLLYKFKKIENGHGQAG